MHNDAFSRYVVWNRTGSVIGHIHFVVRCVQLISNSASSALVMKRILVRLFVKKAKYVKPCKRSSNTMVMMKAKHNAIVTASCR